MEFLQTGMKNLIILLFFSLIGFHSFGQDTLPRVSVTQLGKKVLVSWVNPFKNVTNINIQRSADSLRNFTTIGSVLNVNTETNGFVDTKEFIPSDQYYRLFITFEGGGFQFTTSHRPTPDTTSIEVPVENLNETVQTWFSPSSHVFTGRDNNVVISLPAAKTKKYSIKFYEDDGSFLFEIEKVPSPYLIVDKVNFGHSGLFRFELSSDGKVLERHKFYIPQDGKRMPVLDANGYIMDRR